VNIPFVASAVPASAARQRTQTLDFIQYLLSK
jgi:hypothetical protein